MPPFVARADELPDVFPVFPLGGALLLPVFGRYVRLSYTQDWRTQEFVGQKRYFHFGSFNLSYAW